MQKIATTLPFLLLPFFIWAQTLDLTLDFDNEERSYVLHIPPTYVATESVPLVIALHGLTNSGTILMESSQFDLVADTANFIVAFPTALNNGLGQTAWNNGLFVGSDADDTGFLMELIAVISNEYSIDANRVYFTGFSMGGFMSNRMACEFADEITAIASHSGTIAKTIIEDCEPSRLMPMMHIHGNSDPVVGYDGNWLTGFQSVDTLMRFWRGHNSCPNSYLVEELEDSFEDNITVEKRTYGPCENDIELLLYTADNHGHSWLQPDNDIFSSKEIWDFFKQYSLAEPVSVLQEKVELPIEIYPNPSSDFLSIQIPNTFRIDHLDVFNSLGQVVERLENSIRQISVRDYPPGIYYLQINKKTAIRFSKVND